MRKPELDHMLETAVAKALGVSLPRLNRKMRPAKRTAHHPVKRAA